MIKLNKITDYAVVILGLLSSRSPNKFSTSKISSDTGLSVPTVAKVCKLLNNADLIKAGRGAHGGYYCETSPSEINVAVIVEAIDGPIAITACIEESEDLCDTQSICLLSGNWNKANNAILDALKSVSLSDLLNPEDFFTQNNSNSPVVHT
jgi:FeS assembly SUF system regulator